MDKSKLIKKVSELTDVAEDEVFKIISFQGEDTIKALKEHHQVEISGFGKFLLSQTKLQRQIRNWEIHLQKLLEKDAPDEQKIEIAQDVLLSYKLKVRE